MIKTCGLAITFCIFISAAFAQQKPQSLWYDKPAKVWNEALPIGNGRLGAMFYGGVAHELIQLNEQTLWTGGPVDSNPNPDAWKYLIPVRAALFKDSLKKAVDLLKKMQGPNTNAYQPMGDIIINQFTEGEVSGYKRTLDISNAIGTTSFTSNGVHYSREIFCSAADQVIILKLSSSKMGALNFNIGVKHEFPYSKNTTEDHELILSGKARITNDENGATKPLIFKDNKSCNGMRFQFRIKVVTGDGKINRTDSMLNVTGASTAVLYISGATSFNGFDKCPDSEGKDESAMAKDYLVRASTKNFELLKASHIKDYQKYYNRLNLTLPNFIADNLPTNKRLEAYKKGAQDPGLENLYFDFGRYLFISCSRPGGEAANLQGLWNNLVRPPWRSNYTTNINLQMNYWMAESMNMSELVLPLIEQIKHMAINGERTARNYYRMNGWVLHHNSDIWAQTNPVGEGTGDPKWANWSLGSPWLSQHLFEHYQFSSDKNYLRETAYPIMKGAADFCLDWLVEKDGILLTAPSTSPENVYILPNGTKGTVTIGSAMDMEIIWDLFSNVIESAQILRIDEAYASVLKAKREKLSPLKVGKKGNLVEWWQDFEDEDPQHRHVSHLFGLHPGRQISPLLDRGIADAAKKTLSIRGDGGTGWSKAWKINFWARLLDGDHAYKMYRELLRQSTLNNLFDNHPPFQIDGNFGALAGVSEMLLQSHLEQIQLLPALPYVWTNGQINGIKARGNFEFNIRWKNHKLHSAEIISNAGNTCTLRSADRLKITGASVKTDVLSNNGQTFYIYRFNTQQAKKYKISLL